MKGTAKKMIDKIIEKKAGGNQTLAITTRTKLILKGLNPDKFDLTTPDDPAVIAKLKNLATELSVPL